MEICADKLIAIDEDILLSPILSKIYLKGFVKYAIPNTHPKLNSHPTSNTFIGLITKVISPAKEIAETISYSRLNIGAIIKHIAIIIARIIDGEKLHIYA